MSKSNFAENAWLALLFHASAIAGIADNAASSPLTNLFVALHTADPGETGFQTTNEIAYTGYARVWVPRNNSGWLISGNTVQANSPVTFPVGLPGSTPTATHFSVGATPSGLGQIYYSGTISPSLTCGDGVIPELPSVTITED
jgi:hypothetical protein